MMMVMIMMIMMISDITRVRRDLGQCLPRARMEEVLAEVGVSYLNTLLDLENEQEKEKELEEKEEDQCVEQRVCLTARKVSGLTDKGGLVENLNKILIKTLGLYLLETRDINPGNILAAGDWGRAWQNCHHKYKCVERAESVI